MEDFHPQWWLIPKTEIQVSLKPLQKIAPALLKLNSKYIDASEHEKIEIETQINDMIEYGPAYTIHPPAIVATKGRPVGALGGQSTKRNPSAFEHVSPEKKRRKCSVCNQIGHNARFHSKQ